jgi:hypothetical protein
MLLNNIPNFFRIHPHVAVNENIPKAGNPPPRNIRCPLQRLLRNPFGSLTDDLKIRITASCVNCDPIKNSRP